MLRYVVLGYVISYNSALKLYLAYLAAKAWMKMDFKLNKKYKLSFEFYYDLIYFRWITWYFPLSVLEALYVKSKGTKSNI